ncbi:MAG TPA: inositol monophosphatase [Planctomycetes bacterium]|nr:inositol monophosphatase [Planctomycetota bacterium]
MSPTSDLWAAMEEMARGAGRILMDHFGKLAEGEVGFKGKRDLQTVADRESEEFLLGEIGRRFPGHVILAEESFRGDERATLDSGLPVWIVDPLDGTTNFVHELPTFTVSLGLVDRDGPVAGAVFAPRLDEMFLAVRGEGATLNGRTLRVSRHTKLIDAVLATGFAYRVDEIADDNLDHFCHLIPRTRAIRRFGSAALDLAYTAAGRFDGFWELHLSPWDVAGGACLIREAGGVVTDMKGGDDWLFGRHIVGASPALHPLLLAELS